MIGQLIVCNLLRSTLVHIKGNVFYCMIHKYIYLCKGKPLVYIKQQFTCVYDGNMKFTKKHQKSSVQFSLSECIDIPCIVISIKRGKSSRIVKEISNASLMPVSMQFIYYLGVLAQYYIVWLIISLNVVFELKHHLDLY